MKFGIFLLLVAAFGLAQAQTCANITSRRDCGYLGIQQQECINNGCCWDPQPNQAYCFYKTASCNPTAPRRDCGFVGINQDQCEASGCCWTPSSSGIPWCYYSNQMVSGYGLSSMTPTGSGYEGALTIVQGGSFYGQDISPLHLKVVFETENRLRVRIFDPSNDRYEVPQSVLPDPPASSVTADQANYVFSYTSFPFGFAITRKSDNVVVWNSTANPGSFNGMVFEDQYLEISSQLPSSPYLYGIGEHVRNLKLDTDGSYLTLWARDAASPVNQNIYGSHPFYMEMRNGKAHGVFLRNSNGMDVAAYQNYITFRVIGGILDFYFFMGPQPEDVVQQYHQVIGFPYMPPYWSLGWHQCRYGYHDLNEIQTVVQKYKDNNIPLDTMWTDIDYMNQYLDFTWDPSRFPQDKMNQFVSQLHANGQHYVVIVDPGIHNQPGYAPYDKGLAQDVFIKTSSGGVFIGKVWPGTTAFPDFLHPNASAYWADNIRQFLAGVPLDGLWIDMNEISNFCNGACQSESGVSASGMADPNNPPYRINNCGNGCALNTQTLDANTVHYGGLLEYNVHNLYGMTESIATRAALEAVRGKRALVISRSTFSGSGRHTGHWLGDNYSTWASLQYSIPGVLAMNMFGIPLVGADICGFIGSTTEELCGRWTQVGAFYTFSRNHNTIGAPSQEPYTWPSVANISRTVLGVKYSLLPYYNSLFYRSHTQGGTVLRPLFFEFPNERDTLNIDQQFLVGDALLISPVTQQGATTVSAYIPKGATWYDFWSKAPLSSTGWQTLKAPFDHINIHVRGGKILPMQQPALTTSASRKNPHWLLVALDAQGAASGSLFLDDGETLEVGKDATIVNYSATSSNKLTAVVLQSGYPDATPLDTITILGVNFAIHDVYVQGKAVTTFNYDSMNQVLTITNLGLSMTDNFSVSWN